MADDVLKPLLIAGCFLAFYPLILGMMGPVMGSGGSDWEFDDPELDKYFDAGFLTTNRVWVDSNNNSNYSIPVTESDYGSRFEILTEKKYILFGDNIDQGIRTNAERFRFYNNASESETLDIYIVKDNENYDPDSSKGQYKYHDFIAVVRDYNELLDKRYRVAIVPITGLMNDTSGAKSWSSDADTDYKATVHMVAVNNFTLAQALRVGYNFELMITDSILDDAAKDNTWGMIKNMLTFNFTGNTILDLFISTPFYMMAVYVLIRFVMAFIPFISGM